jgi:hypothetical protein
MVLTGTLKRYAQMAHILCGAADIQSSPLTPRRAAPAGVSGAAEIWQPTGRQDSLDLPPTLRLQVPLQAPSLSARGEMESAEGGGSSGRRPSGGAGPGQVRTSGGRHPRRISLQLHRLNELCAGTLDSLSYEQMQQNHPREYEARAADKLHYRYPGVGGESYMDLILRLDSVILQLEQTHGNVVVVCDRAVCRVLLGYFERFGQLGANLEELPHIDVQGGVIELRRSHSGFSSSHTPITVGATTRVAGPGTERGAGQLSNIRKPVP